MEDALLVIRNKEGVLAGSSSKKNVSSSLNNSGLKGNYHHLEVDEKWGSLSKKEKQFVIELNMKPTSYCTLKR